MRDLLAGITGALVLGFAGQTQAGEWRIALSEPEAGWAHQYEIVVPDGYVGSVTAHIDYSPGTSVDFGSGREVRWHDYGTWTQEAHLDEYLHFYRPVGQWSAGAEVSLWSPQPGVFRFHVGSLNRTGNNCEAPNPLASPCGLLTFNSYYVKGYSEGLATPALTFLGQSAIPEPATWLMLIGGLGAAGAMLRNERRTRTAATSAAR